MTTTLETIREDPMSRTLERTGHVVIIEAHSDPGDMGEPREFSADGTEYVVVPSWEDAALGAAWRRCEAALPDGWRPVQVSADDNDWTLWRAATVSRALFEGENDNDSDHIGAEGPTPTAALEALAEKLEAIR